jgi:hypothetical protein
MAWGDDGMGYEGHEAKDVFYGDFHAEQKPKTTRWNFCNFFFFFFSMPCRYFQTVSFFLLIFLSCFHCVWVDGARAEGGQRLGRDLKKAKKNS